MMGSDWSGLILTLFLLLAYFFRTVHVKKPVPADEDEDEILFPELPIKPQKSQNVQHLPASKVREPFKAYKPVWEESCKGLDKFLLAVTGFEIGCKCIRFSNSVKGRTP